MPAAAIAIPAAISAGGSLFSGMTQANAAKSAAQTQQNGANVAAQTYQDAVNQNSPALVDSAILSGNQVRDYTGQASDDAMNTAYNGGGQVIDAGKQAAAGVNTAAQTGNDLYKGLYDQFSGQNQDFINKQLSPYQQAGQEALGKLSDLNNEKFSFSQDDPSYQWRLQQGQQALMKNKALAGGLQSGAALKSMTNYAQGAASQEYQAAFNRFQTDRNSRGGLLTSLAGFGERANGQNLVANQQQLQANAAYGAGVNANNMTAAEYGGNAAIDTNKFAANSNNQAHQWAGDQRINAEKWAGQAYINGVNNNTVNQIGAGKYRADTWMAGADAHAAGQLGSGMAWGNTIGSLGNIGADAAARYYGTRPPRSGNSGGFPMPVGWTGQTTGG